MRLVKLAHANARSNDPIDLPASIVKPLLPPERRSPAQHERIAASAAEPAFMAVMDHVLDAFGAGVLRLDALQPRPG